MTYLYCLGVVVLGVILIFAVGGGLAAGVGGFLIGHGVVKAALS